MSEGVLRTGKPPPFPTSVPGYRKHDQFTVTHRAFEHQQFQPVHNISATMNGCAQQRFYVRWRTLSGGAVQPGYVPVPMTRVWMKGTPGATGWMAGDGCHHPAFNNVRPEGSDIFDDVIVEVQVWYAAV